MNKYMTMGVLSQDAKGFYIDATATEDLPNAYKEVLRKADWLSSTGAVSWVVRFSVEMLKYIFDNHRDSQRPFKKETTAKRYIKDMRAGRWVQTRGSPIQFTSAGLNQGGQHRIYAAIVVGEPIDLVCAFNCSEKEFWVDDTGTPKSNGDFFDAWTKRDPDFADVPFPRRLPKIIAVLAPLLQSKDGTIYKSPMTFAEMKDYYINHRVACDAVNVMLGTMKGITQGMLGGFCFAATNEKYKDQVVDVMVKIKTGERLVPRSAALYLKNFVNERLRNHSRSQQFEEDAIRTLHVLRKEILGESVEQFRQVTTDSGKATLIDFFRA